MRWFVLLATLIAAGVLAAPAAAVPPTKTSYTLTDLPGTLSGVCSFDVDISSTVDATEIDYFDASGNLTRIYIHAVEQDVFSHGSASLSGLPYTFNLELLFDSAGNLTHAYADGVVEIIVFPGGDLFLSAGRSDFAAHPGVGFLLSPDYGAQGNIAGFCAALA